MAASLQNIPVNSNVYRFITSGKPGKCELCPALVDKLEAHHLSYSPEITIKLCHNCHHRVHFWPQRLQDKEKLILLKKRFSGDVAVKMVKEKTLGLAAFSRLVAPSRSVFLKKLEDNPILARRVLVHSPEKPSDRKVFKQAHSVKS